MGKKIYKRDLVLGLIMLTLSGYILFGKNVIVGDPIIRENVKIGRADFYIKFLSVIMIVIAITVILKALGLLRFKTKDSYNNSTNNIAILSFAALVVYGFILKPIGFYISSFMLITFLTFIIRVKENKINLNDKKSLLKALVISCTFSIIIVSIMLYVFTRWLKVILP